MILNLVPLHTRLDLIQQCVSLLSDEWPNGKHERLDEIESNCPNPPCSLVLLSRQNGETDTVIGHLRIVPVKEWKDMLFVEQVVIEKEKRGRGLGKRLMELVEDYCVQLGYKRLYVGTDPDAYPGLYLRLGYKFTDVRPTFIGTGMLDYVIQLPKSMPYPGWEQFYKPYDGRTLSSSVHTVSQTSSHSSEEATCVSHVEETGSRDKIQIPMWAFDVDGYCCFIKEIA